jgi:hypothetical protein
LDYCIKELKMVSELTLAIGLEIPALAFLGKSYISWKIRKKELVFK